MNEQKDTYFVAVKALLRRGDDLLITHDIFGDWDIPGGRIKPDEFDTPMQDVVRRKLSEELGADVSYKLGEPKVFFRHERVERSTGQKARIFAVGYEAEYSSGRIILGGNHDEFRWVDTNNFVPDKFFTGGWLLGLKEYLKPEVKS